MLFDAVGTLIRPTPSVAAAYAAAGRRHGSPLDEATIATRFRRAFARQESLDRELHNGSTSEVRERARWQAIVSEVFPEAIDGAALFDELWGHFARPDSWAIFDDAAAAWQALEAAGVLLGVASNFDARLAGICAATPPLTGCRHVFISSQLAWRKPNPGFFAAIERALKLRPSELVLVGDDLESDYLAARAAGWHAMLLDREAATASISPRVPEQHRLASLTELPGRIKSDERR